MNETDKKPKSTTHAGNSRAVRIAGWMWMISGAVSAIVVLASFLHTYNSVDYNKSGVLRAGIMLTAYCAVFGMVGLRVLERKLKNITGNAIAGLILSVLPIVGGFFLFRGGDSANPMAFLAMLLAPVIWFAASVLVLIGRKSYEPREMLESQEKRKE